MSTDTTTRYTYDDQRVAEETHVSGSVETDDRYFVFGNYIDETLLMHVIPAQAGTHDLYYAHDHLYSPVALFAANGTVAERYEYDAYGSVQILTSNFSPLTSSLYGNPYAFTGRELDTLDAGRRTLMYYRARTYDPEIGRFMQRDPLGVNPAGGENNPFGVHTQYVDGMSVYEYVASNPLKMLDPGGHSAITVGGGAVLLLAVRCYLPYYHAAQTIYALESDNFKHCWTSCMIARDCGQVISRLGGLAKETRDILGKQLNDYVFENYPDWFDEYDEEVQNRDWGSVILDSIDDLLANKTGYGCAGAETWMPGIGNFTRWFRDSCECCCKKMTGNNQ